MLPADVKIIPGHGSLATRDELASTIDAVKRSSATIRERLAAGADAASVAAEIDAAFPGWGSGFINAERWVQIVQADSNG